MNTIKKIFQMAAAIALTVVVAGCSVAAASPTAAPAPTQDLVALHTEVAQTVVAQLTVEAALHPSATPVQPTNTSAPQPTNTPFATLVAPTLPVAPTQAARWVVQPTATKTAYTDACVLQSTSPDDYSVMDPSTQFDATWVLKNTGARDWNTQFYITKVTGDLGPSGTFFLANTVVKTDSYTFKVDMTAPRDAGTYNGTYKLVNDDGVAICQFFAVVTVK
ncbi:MAG: hypothetical protein LWX83_08415 [Anaerolineae bacterium]|nr:hypothetical protein [Anaerolineae bacterium]